MPADDADGRCPEVDLVHVSTLGRPVTRGSGPSWFVFRPTAEGLGTQACWARLVSISSGGSPSERTTDERMPDHAPVAHRAGGAVDRDRRLRRRPARPVGGNSTLSVGAGVAVRTVLVVLVLVLAPAIAARRHLLDVDRAVLRRSATVGLVLGYLLDPLSWLGRAFVAQSFVPVGVASAVVDLMLWTGVGIGAVLLATRSATHREALGLRAGRLTAGRGSGSARPGGGSAPQDQAEDDQERREHEEQRARGAALAVPGVDRHTTVCSPPPLHVTSETPSRVSVLDSLVHVPVPCASETSAGLPSTAPTSRSTVLVPSELDPSQVTAEMSTPGCPQTASPWTLLRSFDRRPAGAD